MKPTPEMFKGAKFRKAGKSVGNGACVEVAVVGGYFGVRDSKHQKGPVLVFDEREWDAFLDGVHNGEFDVDATPEGRRQ